MNKLIRIFFMVVLIFSGLVLFSVNYSPDFSGAVIVGSGDFKVRCEDSDNIKTVRGLLNEQKETTNVFLRGSVMTATRRTNSLGWNQWSEKVYDSCNGDVLTEYFCTPLGIMTYEKLKCPYGCLDGECVWPICNDGDGYRAEQALYASSTYGLFESDTDVFGLPPKGINGKNYRDVCVSDTKLKEYKCNLRDRVYIKIVDCSSLGNYKCINNACHRI